ncbi:MAG: hypothetical protein II943_08505 [Victivallales bacterium]|nr:hypothetical protein [Victivallales bacterium]
MKPSTTSKKIPSVRSATSQETLKALMLDPNPCISSLAMEQMLRTPALCERLIADNQDTPDLALRRCVHQLAGCLRMQKLREKFIFKFEQGQLDAWEAMLAIDQLYDQRSSRSYLMEATQEFLEGFHPQGEVSLRQVAKFMADRKYTVPPHPILNVFHYLVGDVLDNCQGIALVLCVLARQLARSHGLMLQVCLISGKFCLIDSMHSFADPTEGWKVSKAHGPEDFHLCTNQETIRIYLAQLLASSTVSWETFDVHLFSNLLLSIDGLGHDALPYPYGKLLAPPPDPEP